MSQRWDPDQYHRFRDLRSQPFFDLLAMVEPHEAMRVLDLGCGTGELTREAHRRLQASETLGIDSSPDMLAMAWPLAGEGLRFATGDIASWTAGQPPGPWDLVLSNAALQWLPDHPALFAGLVRLVAPGGQLAVQMPANHDHVSHQVAAEVAASAPFADWLDGFVRRSPVLAAEDYAELLHDLGLVELDVRLQVYAQELADREAVVEWMKGTALTAYAARLDAARTDAFLEAYRARLFARMADKRPLFYPYKRLLMRARRPR